MTNWTTSVSLVTPGLVLSTHPAEVIPEFTVDVGTKKGEKIDYAVAPDGKIQLLIAQPHGR